MLGVLWDGGEREQKKKKREKKVMDVDSSVVIARGRKGGGRWRRV